MSNTVIKSNFHRLIDRVEDTDLLQHFYEALNLLQQHSTHGQEISEELTIAQKSRLIMSLSQSASGKTISNQAMKEKLAQWLSK